MADRTPKIGDLRWPVIIAKRVQSPAGTSTISETLEDIQEVRADVQSLGALTFVSGQQTDRPITHRITIRWLDWLDQTQVIVRRTYRLDRTIREEVFRIRKVAEINGRKRFLEILAEQESRE